MKMKKKTHKHTHTEKSITLQKNNGFESVQSIQTLWWKTGKTQIVEAYKINSKFWRCSIREGIENRATKNVMRYRKKLKKRYFKTIFFGDLILFLILNTQQNTQRCYQLLTFIYIFSKEKVAVNLNRCRVLIISFTHFKKKTR